VIVSEDITGLHALLPIISALPFSLRMHLRDNKDASQFDYLPIHQAARGSDVQIINFVLQMGADINARLENSSTPLHQAAGQGNIKVIAHLISFCNANPYLKTRSKWLPVHVASNLKKKDAVQLFMDLYKNDNHDVFSEINKQVEDLNFRLNHCDYTCIVNWFQEHIMITAINITDTNIYFIDEPMDA